MKPQTLHLYLVTDEASKCRIGLLESVREAIAGGVSIVQYRSENPNREQILAELLPLQALLREKNIPLIINNNLELALEIDADGLHIGQNDVPAAEARAALGPEKIIGLSVSTREQMLAVPTEQLDYIGMGPVFPTISKMNAAPALGIDLFCELCTLTSLPVVAIGGIDGERACEIRSRGAAAGIAVVSAICADVDPCRAAQALC